jgi:hypothetical protein
VRELATEILREGWSLCQYQPQILQILAHTHSITEFNTSCFRDITNIPWVFSLAEDYNSLLFLIFCYKRLGLNFNDSLVEGEDECAVIRLDTETGTEVEMKCDISKSPYLGKHPVVKSLSESRFKRFSDIIYDSRKINLSKNKSIHSF